jgi:hypothetical protein
MQCRLITSGHDGLGVRERRLHQLRSSFSADADIRLPVLGPVNVSLLLTVVNVLNRKWMFSNEE